VATATTAPRVVASANDNKTQVATTTAVTYGGPPRNQLNRGDNEERAEQRASGSVGSRSPARVMPEQSREGHEEDAVMVCCDAVIVTRCVRRPQFLAVVLAEI